MAVLDAPTVAPSRTEPGRKRQWGAERSTTTLPIVHRRPSSRTITLGRLAMIATVLCWAIYVITTVLRQLVENDDFDLRLTLELVSYLVTVTFLTFSALMYMLARQGALYRFRDHLRSPREELDRHFTGGYDKLVTVLIPSYVEEVSVVRQTMWSAALQEFPRLRIVLLVDDPAHPTDPDRIASLAATEALAEEIESALRGPRRRITAAASAFSVGERGDEPAAPQEAEQLADLYQFASCWLEEMAAAESLEDHTDAFFTEQVLRGLAGDLELTELALRTAAEHGEAPARERMGQLYDRLTWIFTAEVTSFQRKRFASLSHEANKAMNINSYISLIGRDWKEEPTAEGPALRPAGPGDTVALSVPASDYLLTLDADSMLLRDYCLRLVGFLEQPGHERVAVTQTPYSSYRGAPTRIERLAGATTDIQHIQHQGMTYYGATFWVGANAVIRTEALEDIARTETVGGFPVTTYIQDRTVIEDTESSIDIEAHGWSLENYPERLSYSATPPDFGSLVVQRRRWANGGLIIWPKLLSLVGERHRRREPVLLREVLLRTNYMASIAWSSFGLLFLLAYPYDSRLLSVWVFLAAVPYFCCMGADLKACGYRFWDILLVYGFNLVLLAVNLAGVLKSLQQMLTGEKIPFARTPKVADRTAAPALFVLVPWAIVAFSLLTLYRDVSAQNWGNAVFALINATLCAAAILLYIGVWNSVVDVVLGFVDWLFVPAGSSRRGRTARRAGAPADDEQAVDWRALLYHGDRSPDLPRDGENLERRRRATGASRIWSTPVHRFASATGDLALVRSDEIKELSDELEGLPELGLEFASAYVTMWPTRLGRLHDAVNAADLPAARDAVGSIKVSAMMVGADQLEDAADVVTRAVTAGDLEAARAAVLPLAEVGEATLEALRHEFLPARGPRHRAATGPEVSSPRS